MNAEHDWSWNYYYWNLSVLIVSSILAAVFNIGIAIQLVEFGIGLYAGFFVLIIVPDIIGILIPRFERNWDWRKDIPKLITRYSFFIFLLIAFWWYSSTPHFKRRVGTYYLEMKKEIIEEVDYVLRTDYEERLNKTIGTLENRKYVIVVGSKGSGKTTILNHVLNGKEGVVTVKYDGETTLSNFKLKLLEAINIQIEPWNEKKAAKIFGEICDSIKRKDDGKITWVPTIVFEVEGSTSKQVIKELYKTAKQMSSDNAQARCILVLSDANACLSMTSDSGRQEYIWIDDFTPSEANNYLDNLGFTSDKEIRTMVLEKLGTKPLDLRDISTSTPKPSEFIEKRIEEDRLKVKDCLDFDKDNYYLELFKKMLKKENYDGIKSIDLDKATSIIAEGPAVKGYHILAFNIEKGIFKFHSNSMREATRRFIETNNNNKK